MKRYMKLLLTLSVVTLFGCAQWSLAPTLAPQASLQPRMQPAPRISSPVSEVEGLFVRGRAAHDTGQLVLALANELSPSSLQSLKNLELLARASQPVAAGPQLVAVGKNIYELRDAPAAPASPVPATVPAGIQTEQAATSVFISKIWL